MKPISKAFWERIDKKSLLYRSIPLAIILGLEIATTSFLPYTKKTVMDSLIGMDWDSFLWFLAISFFNMLILLTVQGFKGWICQKLAFLGRETLMDIVKEPWIKKKGKTDLSTPDVRLNDDTAIATEIGLRVFIEVVISVTIVASLLFTILKWPLLFWSAIIYSGASILMAILFKTPMITKRYILSDEEGKHRTELAAIQDKQVYRTERWSNLRDAYNKYILISRNYSLFHAGQTAILYSVPFLLMAPDLFAHKITVGDIVQGTLTFDLLVINATIWVSLYPSIIAARTAFLRVKEMYDETNSEG